GKRPEIGRQEAHQGQAWCEKASRPCRRAERPVRTVSKLSGVQASGASARWIGAVAVVAAALTLVTSAQAAQFGIDPDGFDCAAVQRGVSPATPAAEAGVHPDLSVGFKLNETTNAFGLTVPVDMLKEVRAELPPGFVGNPRAAGYCTDALILSQNSQSD